jgi:hypothetical protein
MAKITTTPETYNNIRAEIVAFLNPARSTVARNVNSIMTARESPDLLPRKRAR